LISEIMEDSKMAESLHSKTGAPNSQLNHRPTTSSKMDMSEFLNDAEIVQRENSSAERDIAVMKAMGRKQLLDRNFGFISMVGFTTTMMATWEAVGFSLYGGLLCGGPVALIYGFMLCFMGTLATCCSIAELASMYPTAGECSESEMKRER
jgi:amino acid permease